MYLINEFGSPVSCISTQKKFPKAEKLRPCFRRSLHVYYSFYLFISEPKKPVPCPEACNSKGQMRWGGGVHVLLVQKKENPSYQSCAYTISYSVQRKYCPTAPGLVDFAIGLVTSVLNLPDGQVKFFEEFKLQKNCEISSAHQNVFGAS